MNKKQKEMAGILEAISIVSKRLADKLPAEDDTPFVYVASALRGDIKGNVKKANGYCRFVIANGSIPIAPHVFFSGFLDDQVPEERSIGMFLGKEMLRKCDELWTFGEITAGMQEEIDLAKKLNIPVRYFKGEGSSCLEV